MPRISATLVAQWQENPQVSILVDGALSIGWVADQKRLIELER